VRLGVENCGIGSEEQWGWEWKVVGLGVEESGSGMEWDGVG
jgi:hypothetical protein